MKFRWTDERSFAYEFNAGTEEIHQFPDALHKFQAIAIADPSIRKPFRSHLHFAHDFGAGTVWSQLKPALVISQWSELPDWDDVYRNAQRVYQYWDVLDRFCVSVADTSCRWQRLEDMKLEYEHSHKGGNYEEAVRMV